MIRGLDSMIWQRELESFAGKSLLVVDDEEIVVEIVTDVFGKAMSVLDTAFDGLEAIEKLGRGDFDFILLDIEMPRMNGKEFFNFIRRSKPHLQKNVIFITGDTETESTRSFIASSGCRFLDKPFMIRDLIKVMAIPV